MQLNLGIDTFDKLFKQKSVDQCYKDYSVELIRLGLDLHDLYEAIKDTRITEDEKKRALGAVVLKALQEKE